MRDDRHFNGRRQVCQSHSSARLPDSRIDLAERTFQRRFQLADHVVVKGARPENGLLHVGVVRELPEAMRPRAIPIASSVKILEVHPRPRASPDVLAGETRESPRFPRRFLLRTNYDGRI
jgi:hypothetical protein